MEAVEEEIDESTLSKNITPKEGLLRHYNNLIEQYETNIEKERIQLDEIMSALAEVRRRKWRLEENSYYEGFIKHDS